LAQQGFVNPYDNFHGQLRPFMCARSKLIELGNVSFYNQITADVAQRALRESSEDSNDERGNVTLSKALQIKEQQGRVRRDGNRSGSGWVEQLPARQQRDCG
jgi:hypothetical protein